MIIRFLNESPRRRDDASVSTFHPFSTPARSEASGCNAGAGIPSPVTRAEQPHHFGLIGRPVSEDQVPETRGHHGAKADSAQLPGKRRRISAVAGIHGIPPPRRWRRPRMNSPRRGCEMVLMVAIAAMSVRSSLCQIERILAVRHVSSPLYCKGNLTASAGICGSPITSIPDSLEPEARPDG